MLFPLTGSTRDKTVKGSNETFMMTVPTRNHMFMHALEKYGYDRGFTVRPCCCHVMRCKTASTVLASVVLKRLDDVLAKVKDSISFESFTKLRNAKLSLSAELFAAEAVEKSSHVLHDEAIRKAVSAEKLAHKSAKKLYFSQPSQQQQQAKCLSVTTAGKSSYHPSASGSSSGYKTSSSARRGKWKKF